MANPWFRLYAEFANDPKVQMMPEVDQRRLVMLFCIRCNGDETLHDEQVAFQLRISNEDWLVSKSTFLAKGFINEANEVLNWNKRQYVSDSSTSRVAKHRQKKKQQGNVSVTSPDTDTDTEPNSKGSKKKKTVVGDAQAKPSPKKGTRLPENFNLTKSEAEWSLKEQATWDIDHLKLELEKFRDYWIAQPGQKGVKTDWKATWRNWVRNAGPKKSVTAEGTAKVEKPWFITGPGIEKKGEELGLSRGRDEHYNVYYARVIKAAGITEEQVRRANIDFGQKK